MGNACFIELILLYNFVQLAQNQHNVIVHPSLPPIAKSLGLQI